MVKIRMWTDGSCNKGGIGGIGVYVQGNLQLGEITLRRGYTDTTTPRMEMRALLEGIRMINPMFETQLTIYTDSQFVANAFLKGWLAKWRMNSWVGVKNVDLWKAIIHEIALRRGMRLKMVWIHGHAKNLASDIVFGNHCADALADYRTQDSYIHDYEELPVDSKRAAVKPLYTKER